MAAAASAVHAGWRQPAPRVARRPSTSGFHYVKQDGQAVFKFAVRNTEEACGSFNAII